MRRQIILAAIVSLCGLPARAEIILQSSDLVDLRVGGLFQFIVSAVGTEGEQISRFSDLSVTGTVHQVWRLDPAPTWSIDTAAPSAAYAPDWAAFDSHLLVPAANRVGAIGFLAEANDLSTTGTLGLSTLSGMEAPSGIGDITDNSFGFTLIPGLADSQIPFFQVVTTSGTAFVSATIGAEGGIEQRIENFPLGIPEPSSIWLSGLAVAGLAGCLRRR